MPRSVVPPSCYRVVVVFLQQGETLRCESCCQQLIADLLGHLRALLTVEQMTRNLCYESVGRICQPSKKIGSPEDLVDDHHISPPISEAPQREVTGLMESDSQRQVDQSRIEARVCRGIAGHDEWRRRRDDCLHAVGRFPSF